MRLDLLYAHCADLGLEVEWGDLAPRYRGVYLDDHRRIILDHQLTRVQVTSTLSHEVGHATFGDRCSSRRNELRAWEYGASLIITPTEYAAAEELVGPHPGALALELGVTPKVVEAWRRWFAKRRPVELTRRLHPDWAEPSP